MTDDRREEPRLLHFDRDEVGEVVAGYYLDEDGDRVDVDARWWPNPAQLIYAPPRWPAPDYERDGYVSRAWLPDDITVGYLVWQDDALVYYDVYEPSEAARGASLTIANVLATALADGLTARDAWDAANRAALFEVAERMPLEDFLVLIRRAYGME